MSGFFERYTGLTSSLVALLLAMGVIVGVVFAGTQNFGWRITWLSTLAVLIAAAMLISTGASMAAGWYVLVAQLGVAALSLLSICVVSGVSFVVASRISRSRVAAVIASVAGAIVGAPLFIVVAYGLACTLGECS